MGKRLAISQPAVIQTELRPLSENFWIESSGQLEQWYYQNNGVYSPDRQITPLILAPHLSALDEDTGIDYTDTSEQTSTRITFSLDRWIVKEWNGTQWVTTEITTGSQSADYVLMGVNLKVQKNSPDAAHAINITCKAQYIDPRDTGMTHWIEGSIMLTTNVDATVVYPSIDIKQPHTQAYNPLKASTPLFDFEAVADWSRVEAQGVADIAEYYADPKGTEEVLVQQGSCSPTLDIKYGETAQTAQKFLYRQISNGEVASIPSQRATLTKIKGDSVKWNQLNYNIKSTSQYGGITFTNNNDGSWTVDGTSGESTSYYFISEVFTQKKGHYYLIKGGGGSVRFGGYKETGMTPSGSDVIILCPKTSSQQLALIVVANTTISNVTITPMLFDLTEIYGEGNEPSTPEAFEADYEAWFGKPLSYEPYDEGSVRSVKMTGIKSVGFNIFNKTEVDNSTAIIAESGATANNPVLFTTHYIKVIENNTYRFSEEFAMGSGTYGICYYDNNKNYISGIVTSESNISFLRTIPNGVSYIRICGKIATIDTSIINISDPSRNGTYEAYKEATAQVPITTLTGKLLGVGESVVVFPQGMNHIGDVYDEIESMFDGGVVKATKRFGVVTLTGGNSEIYNLQSINEYNIANFAFDIYSRRADGIKTIICDRLLEQTSLIAQSKDRGYFISMGTTVYIRIESSIASTTKQLKSYLSSNPITFVYELANPQEYILDELPRGMFEWYGIRNNQEVLIDTLPCYTQAQQESGYGQHTSKIRINALYGDNIAVILRLKRTPWDATPMPMKEYRNVVWKIPPVDVIVTCDKGSAIRAEHVEEGNVANFTFSTIVNQQGEVISDEVKAAHMRFDWYSYIVGASGQAGIKTSHGSGLTKAISARILHPENISSELSTNVYCEAYVLGPYQEVTENGVTTYERS